MATISLNSIPQVEAYLTQRAEGVLTDADQVLVTEVASRAGEVMARYSHVITWSKRCTIGCVIPSPDCHLAAWASSPILGSAF